MHLSARLFHLRFKAFQVEIQVCERVLLDRSSCVPKRLEFRKISHCLRALLDETRGDVPQGLLQTPVLKRHSRVAFECSGVSLHFSPGSWAPHLSP